MIQVPEYDFPPIPLLPFAYNYKTETPLEILDYSDLWIVPGSYLRSLDVYFTLITDVECKYEIDKEYYNGKE